MVGMHFLSFVCPSYLLHAEAIVCGRATLPARLDLSRTQNGAMPGFRISIMLLTQTP